MADFNGCCPIFLGLDGLYDRSGVLKVTCFLVLMVSNALVDVSLGIWNFTIPNLSDAAYDKRILGLVVS